MAKYPYQDSSLSIEERAKDLLSRMSIAEKTSQLLHESKAVERLDVPEYNWWNECLHGIARAGKATIFPQAIGMAAAFDEEMMYRVADAISDEARAKYHENIRRGSHGQYRGLTFWTPNINIFRDPRWGRGQETYGEDPFLTTRLGVSFVKGLQQEKQGVMKAAACAKHYAVHSGPEALRHEFDAKATPKDMRETYLPAFEALVKEAKVESVMGAYNRTNGEVCCGSKTLLKDILRDEWGFTGHVVSDCWAIRDFHEFHKITKTPFESAALALNNGCDLNCGCTFEVVLDAIEMGLISEQTIDNALMNLLRTRIKLGLFNSPDKDPWSGIPLSVVDCEKHRALAREVAAKSLVLLKNSNNILPLDPAIGKLYLTGPNAVNIAALIGNYYGVNDRIITPLEGIAGAVSATTVVDYRPGALLDRKNPNPVEWAIFEARTADAVIAFLGIDGSIEGEEGDAIASNEKGDRASIELPGDQLAFFRKLKDQGKPVIAVIFGGSPIALGELHELADAIIWAWYPGEEGGNAIADVIFGKTAPSGKLPLTFPKSLAQLPAYEDYSMKGRSYRYMNEDPLYPFGFGLSYCDFLYSDIAASSATLAQGQTLKLQCTLTNSGTRECTEVAQLYVSAADAPFTVPRCDLRAFARFTLAAGERKTIDFTLPSDAFGLIDDEGNRYWHKGTFTVTIGGASPGKRSRELGAAESLEIKIQTQ